jgi:signal peptidase I
MRARHIVILSGLGVGPALAVLWLLRRKFQFVVVCGESMAPTLHHGDLVLGRRRVPAVSTGDLVVFPVFPDDYEDGVLPGRPWRRVKRVVAVAGDSAPSSLPASLRRLYDGAVPEGHVALDGDALVSEGSAQFGYIGVERIESTVVRRLRRGNASQGSDTRIAHAGASASSS